MVHVGLLAAVLLALTAAGAPPTPAPALFTAAQAHDGSALFAQDCAKCHGAALTGGSAPDLFGPAFTASSLSMGALNTVVTQSMPLDNPGSLSATQYAAIISYILAANCYPAGATPYPSDGTVPDRAAKVATQNGATAPCGGF